VDRNGNPYATPPAIGAFEIGVIFSDGFESGGLASWAPF
jgi:hypothetical protein